MVRELGPDCIDTEAEVPGYQISRAADDERAVWQVMAAGFDVAEDVGKVYHQAYVTASEHQRTDVYKAEPVPRGEIAAVGYLSWIGDGSS